MDNLLREKKLTVLFESIPVPILNRTGDGDPIILGVEQDSRLIKAGDIFIASSGGTTDGHAYIDAAIKRGAAAVVGSLPASGYATLGVPYIQVEDPRFAMAHLAAALFDFPARKLTVIGVTGTDGKTTTSNIIFQILKHAGFRAGIISTVNAVIGDEVVDTGFHVTTPEAQDVQRYLAQMVAARLTHVVLESTSHGLAQHRVTACEYDVAVVTNITHEHLDYHGSYEAYRSAKGRLFTELLVTSEKPQGNPRVAILNGDDQSYEYLRGIAPGTRYAYSLNAGDVQASDIRYDADGLRFIVHGPGFEFPVQSRLIGNFNVSNILAAVGATVVALGVTTQAAQAGIAALEVVPGRMEQINLGQKFIAIVDFAHTPNALRRALETVRGMTGKRIIAVFGSAGLRDRMKRRMMAEVSNELADVSIFTAEDPRTESLDAILEEMAEAAHRQGGEEGETYFRVPDRGEAIRLAIRLARPGDLVISCGKGHEQSMCFGTQEYAWDDRVAMRAALTEFFGKEGPAMPYLPTSAEKPQG